MPDQADPDNDLGDVLRTGPLALPTLAALHALPPPLHIIAQCDPLADGDLRLAARLAAAGNQVTSRIYRGAMHSFLEAIAILQLADRALAELAAWLRSLDQLAGLADCR